MFFCVQKASCKRLLNQIDTLPTQPPFEQEISNLISKGAGGRPWVSPPFLRSAISLWFKLHRFCLHQQEYREKWIQAFAHTPKKQRRTKRCSMFRWRLQPIPWNIVIFGMFSGQRSIPGNGLSRQPRDCRFEEKKLHFLTLVSTDSCW